MELDELQNMWKHSDKKISENTHLNKEILKKMVVSKTENKILRTKIKTGLNLIIPFVLIVLIVLPNISYRPEPDFYIGLILFGSFYLAFYYWHIRYFTLLEGIDLKKPITKIRSEFKKIEKYKFMMTKLSFVFAPLAIIGIFLLGEIPIFSKDSVLPIFLIALIMSFSVYFTIKYSIFEYFKRINSEIDEIEKLES